MIPTMTNVDHVCFTVPDLAQAVAFFEEVCGAQLVFELGPFADDTSQPESWMYEQLRVDPGSTLKAAILWLGTLGLELYEIEAAGQRVEHVRPQDIGAPHLSFRVADFDAAYAYLVARDDVIVHGVPQAPDEGHLAGMRWLHFESPWGLVLEIDEWPSSPYAAAQAQSAWAPAA